MRLIFIITVAIGNRDEAHALYSIRHTESIASDGISIISTSMKCNSYSE